MDGTTAGALGPVPPIPQSPTPSIGAAPLSGSPVPVMPPQFSQVTPVYAPTPTNTLADIPQPTVKGIEFVQAPPVLQPVTPIASTQPSMPPTPAPIPSSNPAELSGSGAPQPLTIAEMSGPANYARIENQIEDVDLDQMVNAIPASMPQAVPPTIAPVAAPVQAPITPVAATPSGNYFQKAHSIVSDVPIREARPGFAMTPKLKLILIILGAVIVLGVGVFFVVSALTGNKETATTETSQPATTDETTTTPSTEMPTDTTTTESSPTTEEAPVTTPAVTETPAVVTMPATTTTETPATTTVTQPVFEAPDSVPAVANSGIR